LLFYFLVDAIFYVLLFSLSTIICVAQTLLVDWFRVIAFSFQISISNFFNGFKKTIRE